MPEDTTFTIVFSAEAEVTHAPAPEPPTEMTEPEESE